MPAIIIIIMLIELLNNNGILLNTAVCASAVLSANTVPLGPYNCLMTSSFSFLMEVCVLSWCCMPRGNYQDEDAYHSKVFPISGLLLPILETSQPFVTVSFEMHVVFIRNILIVPLISFKRHKKYRRLDPK